MRFLIKMGLVILLILSPIVLEAADNTKAVSVGDTATQIVGLQPGRKILVLYNNGSATVYLGFTSADCTTNSALPLPVGTYIILKDKANRIYGIVASGTEEVRVWDDQ